MRILIVTNLYPPHFVGGYEIGCQEAATELRKRGHDVRVLTSTYHVDGPQVDDNVYRLLSTDIEWKDRLGQQFLKKLMQKERTNQSCFRTVLRKFKPDLVYFWNPYSVSVSLVGIARTQKIRTAFYIFDDWLALWSVETDSWFGFWQRPAGTTAKRLSKMVLQLMAQATGLLTDGTAIEFDNVQFATTYLQNNAAQAGKNFRHQTVIRWGLDNTKYPFKDELPGAPLRLLFVGQLIQQKGVHTLIEMLRVLQQSNQVERVCLDIVGTSAHAEYIDSLKQMVEEAGLQERVKFLGMLPREALVQVYQDHDVLIFPSVWNEPFGIVLLEAMASGLPVVATATGGSAEILENKVNSLTFAKENPEDCARQVLALLDDKELFEKLRRNGRHTVDTRFALVRTFNQIEESLLYAEGTR